MHLFSLSSAQQLVEPSGYFGYIVKWLTSNTFCVDFIQLSKLQVVNGGCDLKDIAITISFFHACVFFLI